MYTRIFKLRIGLSSGIALASALLTVPAFATAISGTANLDIGNGAVAVSGNGTTSGCINFYNGPSPDACGVTNGTFSVTAGSNAPFVINDVGVIKDLPFNVSLPMVGFMTIPGEGFTFDLTAIAVNGGSNIGSCSAPGDNAPGATCTPAFSPFQLTNGLIDPATGVVDTVGIQFTINAHGYSGSSSTGYTNYRAIFTTQTPVNGTIDTVLTTIGQGGQIQASWSAAFAPLSAVPEPFSMSLCSIGLAGICLLGRKLRRS